MSVDWDWKFSENKSTAKVEQYVEFMGLHFISIKKTPKTKQALPVYRTTLCSLTYSRLILQLAVLINLSVLRHCKNRYFRKKK